MGFVNRIHHNFTPSPHEEKLISVTIHHNFTQSPHEEQFISVTLEGQ